MPTPDTELASALSSLSGRAAKLREAAARLRPRAGWAQADSKRLAVRFHELQAPRHGSSLHERIRGLETELDGIRTAMQTRAVIEQAKGMIMLRDHCDADAAFAMLVTVSQHSHRKLRDVSQIVVDWGTRFGEPDACVG